jgi:uncharacterized paraquat-inducible protein A
LICQNNHSSIVGVKSSAGGYRGTRKACIECEISFPSDGFVCPCCKRKLRTRTKNNRYTGVRY